MELILLSVFIATQLGDFITTKMALSRGGSEANPIVKKSIDKFGNFGLAGYKLFASIFMAGIYWSGITGEFFVHLMVVMIGFYAYILYNNIKVIRVLNG